MTFERLAESGRVLAGSALVLVAAGVLRTAIEKDWTGVGEYLPDIFKGVTDAAMIASGAAVVACTDTQLL